MYSNFDDMDLEPKSEHPSIRNPKAFEPAKNNKLDDEKLQNQLLLRTVVLDDGCIGYVFTCTNAGPVITWRCHVCNFVDTWRNLLKHTDTKWHKDNMSKYQHPRSNFSKVENDIQDFDRGQPLPPGIEDVIVGPCQILKTLRSFDKPLIGLEFLLEFDYMDFKEPRYLCMLCDKRGDPRSILVHLTSQSHYLIYLRKYFRRFYSLIDKLPKSNECRGNVNMVTAHLIAKLEEKYGRLQPTATRENLINNPAQKAILLQKIDHSVHFWESFEDSYLEEMLTIEYVQNTALLLKKFPLKPKTTYTGEKINICDDSKSLFRISKIGSHRHLPSRGYTPVRNHSPDSISINSNRPDQRHGHRGHSREFSPEHRSRRRSNSPDYGRHRHESPNRLDLNRYRPRRSRSRSHSSYRRRSRSPESRYAIRYPLPTKYLLPKSLRHRSPERHRGQSPPPDQAFVNGGRHKVRSRSRGRTRSRSSHRVRERIHPSRSRSPIHEVVFHVVDSVGSSDEKFKLTEADKLSYLNELKRIEKIRDVDLEKYSDTPENHPAYQEEWKQFWCARFRELQAEGKFDPHTYDYKPEWIDFWNARIEELCKEEMLKRKEILKLQYGVPEDEEIIMEETTEVLDSKEEVEVVKDKPEKPVADIKTMWKELTGFEIREENTKCKSPSPWEENIEKVTTPVMEQMNEDPIKHVAENSQFKDEIKRSLSNILNEYAQPISPEPLSSISDTESLGNESPLRKSKSESISRSRSRSRSRSKAPSHPPDPISEYLHARLQPSEYPHAKDAPPQYPYTKDALSSEYPYARDPPPSNYPFRKPSKKIQFDNSLNIITVLRQLSVLEYQLGSYASHIINLLSHGLAMERIKPQSSVDLLTQENIIFLELVKEKLKGQLLAGVVQKAMVKATLFCIKNIDELLLQAPKMESEEPPPIPAPPPGLLYGTPGPTSSTATPLDNFNANTIQNRNNRRQRYQRGYPVRGNVRKMRAFNTNFSFGSRPFEESVREKLSAVQNSFGNVFTSQNQSSSLQASIQEDNVAVDERAIALQIAEVLTSEGRTDVSEEELRLLINTVVENFKEEQKGKLALKEKQMIFKEKSIPMEPPSLSTLSQPPSLNTPLPAVPPLDGGALGRDFPTIPAGFNLNDVSNSTFAMLQDAYQNVSLSKSFDVESLSEEDLIQMLRNFKNVPRLRQEKLIQYLKKLEDTNPARVEELKKYVTVS